MEELKPCPFCNHKSALLNSEVRYDLTWFEYCEEYDYDWVSCNKCSGEGPPKETKEEAIKAWNTRA